MYNSYTTENFLFSSVSFVQANDEIDFRMAIYFDICLLTIIISKPPIEKTFANTNIIEHYCKKKLIVTDILFKHDYYFNI
jgi:hypothetical protein